MQWIFNNHSTERFFERTALNATKKQIAKAITNNQITYFKRVNTTRSMAYIHVNKEVIKTVMHRDKRKIITILPWKSIFQYSIELKVHKYKSNFKIKMFPDCYLETGIPNALTVMYQRILCSDGTKRFELMQYNHPLFNELFGLAWAYFQNDDDHINIREERKQGNETFEIKGKAKKIKTIIECGIYCEEPI